jgi:hypothetical protein
MLQEEWDGDILDKIISLAGEYGFDISPEDFNGLRKTAGEIPDEELDCVSGGSGQYSEDITIDGKTFTLTYSCELVPDDQTFQTRMNQYPNDCPDYQNSDSQSLYSTTHGSCFRCVHLKSPLRE